MNNNEILVDRLQCSGIENNLYTKVLSVEKAEEYFKEKESFFIISHMDYDTEKEHLAIVSDLFFGTFILNDEWYHSKIGKKIYTSKGIDTSVSSIISKDYPDAKILQNIEELADFLLVSNSYNSILDETEERRKSLVNYLESTNSLI